MDHIVWDWNGTLFDDVRLCLDCINRLLQKHGLSPLETLEQYREVFGFPVADYYRRIGFDFDCVPFAALAEEYMADYQEKSAQCPLYPDVLQTLRRGRELGLGQIVLSARKKDYLMQQMEQCGVQDAFDSVWGIENIYATSKEELAHLLRESLPPADRLWFVGDSLHDAHVAGAVQAGCVLVSTGHQSRARLESAGVPVADSLWEGLSVVCGEAGMRV